MYRDVRESLKPCHKNGTKRKGTFIIEAVLKVIVYFRMKSKARRMEMIYKSHQINYLVW